MNRSVTLFTIFSVVHVLFLHHVDAAESDGLTTDQAVAITVPIVVVTILLVTACAILIIFIIYAKFRYVQCGRDFMGICMLSGAIQGALSL